MIESPITFAAMRLRKCHGRMLAEVSLVSALAFAALGCDDDCGEGLPEGTRFEVSVLEDSLGCYTPLTTGDTFFVIAGKEYEVDGCPVSPGDWKPAFAQTELTFGECESFINLGVKCEVTFPDCAAGGSYMEIWFTDAPSANGQSINTDLRMRLQSACGSGCGGTVPVRIKWL